MGLIDISDNTAEGFALVLMGIFILEYSESVKNKSKEKGYFGRLFGVILFISGAAGLVSPEDSKIGSLVCIIIGFALLDKYKKLNE